MPDLIAGYTLDRDGRVPLGWRGALRRTSRSAPLWRCACKEAHASAHGARRCAEAEKERRSRAGREVFWLRRCEPCDRWWPQMTVPPCPSCGVLMEQVKLVVLERRPAVDERTRKILDSSQETRRKLE